MINICDNMYISPGTAPNHILKQFPKTHFFIAENDTLRDQSLLLIDRLI